MGKYKIPMVAKVPITTPDGKIAPGDTFDGAYMGKSLEKMVAKGICAYKVTAKTPDPEPDDDELKAAEAKAKADAEAETEKKAADKKAGKGK